MKAKILWIEGKRADSPSFIPILRKKDFLEIETVSSGTAALERASEITPDMVIVNAASLRTSGKRICRSLRDQLDGLPIILITNQPPASPADTCASVVLTLPFTARKLMNRIAPFIPGESENLLVAGVIRLDLDKKQVSCDGREARLTPRLARILQILIARQGEVVEREQLFREVWKTEYTVDTRTLDVHISWLRQAIEADPRKPRYLKTVRKIGYRLDI
jgi:DNA-binding response OmpR family regulator